MACGSSQPAAQPSTTTSIQDVPAWEQGYLTNLLGQAQTTASQPDNQIFPGQQVAGFTPDQQQAFSNVENLSGSYQPTLNAATTTAANAANTAGSIYGAGAPSIQASTTYNPLQAVSPYLSAATNAATPQGIQQYMSPYTNDVVNGIQNEANLNWNQNIMPGVNNEFVGSGQGLSGRAAQVLGQAAGNFQTGLSANVANALQSGYTTAGNQAATEAGILGNAANTAGTATQQQASNLLNSGTALGNLAATQGSAQNTAANTLGNLGVTQENAALTNAQALQAVGQQQQQLNQSNINTAMSNYEQQATWPQQQEEFESGIIRGLPAMGSATTTAGQTTPNVYAASPLSSIGGAGVAAAALANGNSTTNSNNNARGGLIKGFAGGGQVGPVNVNSLKLAYAQTGLTPTSVTASQAQALGLPDQSGGVALLSPQMIQQLSGPIAQAPTNPLASTATTPAVNMNNVTGQSDQMPFTPAPQAATVNPLAMLNQPSAIGSQGVQPDSASFQQAYGGPGVDAERDFSNWAQNQHIPQFAKGGLAYADGGQVDDDEYDKELVQGNTPLDAINDYSADLPDINVDTSDIAPNPLALASADSGMESNAPTTRGLDTPDTQNNNVPTTPQTLQGINQSNNQQMQLLALARGMMSPTKTGSPFENLGIGVGNVEDTMLKQQEMQQKQNQLGIENRRNDIAQQRADSYDDMVSGKLSGATRSIGALDSMATKIAQDQKIPYSQALEKARTAMNAGDASGHPAAASTAQNNPNDPLAASYGVDQGTGQAVDANGDSIASAAPAASNSMDAKVDAVIDGRLMPPSPNSRSPDAQALLAAVVAKDPSFDMTDYQRRAKTRASFANGQDANSIAAINTAIPHIAALKQSFDNLGNSDYPTYNAAKNWLGNELGNKSIQANTAAVNTDAIATSHELAKIFRNSGMSEGEIKDWQKQITTSAAPASSDQVIQSALDLTDGRLNALRDKYNQGMNTSKQGIEFLSPSSQAVYTKLRGGAAQPDNSPLQPSNQSSGKIASQADIAETARNSGKSIAEVTQAALKKGYTIQ